METLEVARTEYDSLRDKANRADELQRQLDEERGAHDKTKSELGEAKTSAEQAEAAKVAAEERAQTAEKKVSDAEETARKATLRDERLEKLGAPFKAALDKREVTRKNLHEQASALTDEQWTSRLEEVAELLGVKPDDEKADDPTAAETFSREETARAGAGALGGTSPDEPHSARVGSVVGSLFSRPAPKPESQS